MAVPPPCPSSDKASLRSELRRARADFVALLDNAARADALQAVESRCAHLLAREGSFAGYVAHRGEVDILPLLARASHAGRLVALPHIAERAPDGAMTFVRWIPDEIMVPGLANILQPATLLPIEPDILLVPVVGFDRGGHRLGQGGGFYDRWFADHPRAMRVGIAWSVQEVPALPIDPWDMPLHAIATEKEWIEP